MHLSSHNKHTVMVLYQTQFSLSEYVSTMTPVQSLMLDIFGTVSAGLLLYVS